jgi:hypothetical protein
MKPLNTIHPNSHYSAPTAIVLRGGSALITLGILLFYKRIIGFACRQQRFEIEEYSISKNRF